jgi:hypothetical protein
MLGVRVRSPIPFVEAILQLLIGCWFADRVCLARFRHQHISQTRPWQSRPCRIQMRQDAAPREVCK